MSINMTITNSGRAWMATVLFGAFKSTNPPALQTVLTVWTGSPAGTTTSYAVPVGVIKDTTGRNVDNVYYIPGSSPYAALSLLSFNGDNNTSYHHFAVGSGTTAPTENDHALTAPITRGVTISLAANRGDKKGTYFVTVLNSGSEALTVSEIGFICRVFTASGGQFADVLFARGVLDEPVELAANGGSKTFDVTITF